MGCWPGKDAVNILSLALERCSPGTQPANLCNKVVPAQKGRWSGETVTSLCMTGKASWGRWERLRSDEGRERSKGRPEEFGLAVAIQLLKSWLSPLSFIFLLVGCQYFMPGPLGGLLFFTPSLSSSERCGMIGASTPECFDSHLPSVCLVTVQPSFPSLMIFIWCKNWQAAVVVLGDCWIPSFFYSCGDAARRIDGSDLHLAFSGNCHMFLKILSVGESGKKEGEGDSFWKCYLKIVDM